MNAFKVNLDYEWELFDSHYKHQEKFLSKKIALYEFIYFFLQQEDSELLTNIHYDKDYLSYLDRLGFKIPTFIFRDNNLNRESFKECKNWWGPIENIELERHFNSKLTSLKYAQSMNLAPQQSTIIKNYSDIQKQLITWNKLSHQQTKYRLKSPYLLSGMGQYRLDEKCIDKKNESEINHWLKKNAKFDGNFILESDLNCVLEFAHLLHFPFEPNIETSISNFQRRSHWNWVDKSGTYRGALRGSPDNPLQIMWKRFPELEKLYLESVLPNLNHLITELKNFPLKGNFGIDSFFYYDNLKNEYQVYFPLEFNYRKTLSELIHIKPIGQFSHYSPPKIFSLMILPHKFSRIWPFHDHISFQQSNKIESFSWEKGEGVIWASPPQHNFLMLLIASDNIDSFHKLINQIKVFIDFSPLDFPLP
jgi:hypothetical protein